MMGDRGSWVRKHTHWTLALLVSGVLVLPAQPAAAATTCGTSGSHTICITVPDTPLVGSTDITVTNSPNSGKVIVTWRPSGGPTMDLITRFGKSPKTNDYSFVWPTHKYLDAAGDLRAQFGSNELVQVSVTLANGNTTDFQHSANDWASYLPGSSTAGSDPVIAASIDAADPPLFLFLGDIYEQGTFAENRNMYGSSSLDVPGGGTLWGRLA